MGMYDYLHNISRNIEQNQVDIKKSQEHQRRVEYVKNELDAVLFTELQEQNDLYSDNTKDIVIDNIINETDLILYNVDYTRQYLNRRFYTIARQVEQINKKQNATNDNWRRDLAIAKFEYQKQKDQAKIDTKQQQIEAQQKALRNQQIMNALGVAFGVGCKILVFTCKATMYMLLAPLFVIALFGGGFLGGMIKLK